MTYSFPPYIAMNQPQVHVCPFPLGPPLPPPTPSTPLGCHRALGLSSLGYRPTSHQQSVLHLVMEMFQCSSLHSSTLSFPHCAHKSVLYVCVSIAALQIGSSVPPSFQFYIYALMQNICSSLSDLLHSVLKALRPFTSLELSQIISCLWLWIIHLIGINTGPFFCPGELSTFWFWLIVFSVEM